MSPLVPARQAATGTDEPRVDDSRLAVTVTWVAAAISIFLAVAVPSGYWLLSVEAQLREATVAARLHAAFVTQVVQSSPTRWADEIGGLIDADVAPTTLPEWRGVTDSGGRLVASSGVDAGSLAVAVSAPVLGPDGPVGEVRIQRSLMPVVGGTVAVALLSIALGLAIFASLRVMPLRALRRTLEALRRQEARARHEAEDNLRLVFENSVEGIVVFSPHGRVLSCNAAAAQMFGVAEADAVGLPMDRLVEPVGERFADAFPTGRFESTARRRDGAPVPVDVTISESGIAGQARRIAILRDITERKLNEERLSRMANFDGLTGLPNRSAFRERLQRALDRAASTQRRLALMFLDIDRFKTINDSLGHEFGDRLLVQVASRLGRCVRATARRADGTHGELDGTVYRLGGDEFTVVLEDVDGPEPAAAVARRILRTLAEPIVVGEHELFISASIGITMFPDAETDLDGLVRQADLAMYHSKENGRDTYSFFNAELNAAATERHALETSLRQAFERHEFRLVYQPKADLRTGAVKGVEALLRWRRPDGTEVGPGKFIPILEETGLIVPVGAWVMREACSQLVAWDRLGLPPLSVAVNLSARQFRQQDLIEHIAATLVEFGLGANRLEIELTEGTLIEDSEAVTRIMASLGALGVAIAIDDFGTGHSSLSYLKRFDVDTLKIDQSFVRDTPDDPEDNAIAIAVIALAHGLGLRAVAEGVENEAQAEFLRRHGCDEIQGHLLSRPLEAGDLEPWLRARLGSPRPAAALAPA